MRARRYLAALAAFVALAGMSGCGSSGHPDASVPASPRSTAHAPAAAASVRSVCGLPGFVESGEVTAAPHVDKWGYEDQSLWPYPTSHSAGPGRTSASTGVRSCFAHTPEGALFAAANIAAMMTSPKITSNVDAVIGLFGKGPEYQRVVDSLRRKGMGPQDQNMDARAAMGGFRMLSYDATHAVVDLAYRGTSMGQSIDMSIVYRLVWSDGDWKLRSETEAPITSNVIGSLSGYVEWNEGK